MASPRVLPVPGPPIAHNAIAPGSAVTKFYVTVCLPAHPGRDVAPAVEAQLAPYGLFVGDDYHPDGEWDWWDIRGDLPVRSEHDGSPMLVHNPVHRNGDIRPRRPLRCDGGPKRMLDLPALRAAAAAEARGRWRAWSALTRQFPPAESLSALLARCADESEARQRHLAQPLVQEVAQRAVRGDQHFGAQFLLMDPVAHFGGAEQDYVDEAVQYADFTHALITTDGRWIDPYRMSDQGPDEAGYRRYRTAYLEDLDDEAVIVSVLCHC